MKEARIYLLISALGLLPIALSYGVQPDAVLPRWMNLQPMGTDMLHLLRAIMGLYLGMVALWLLGAWRGGSLLRAALISEVVFMAGLAAGRLLSLSVDGPASPIFIVYTVAELALATWGVRCLKNSHDN